MAIKKVHVPDAKDDGTRWIVVRDGEQVYPGNGVTRDQAERLNSGLLEPGEIVEVSQAA